MKTKILLPVAFCAVTSLSFSQKCSAAILTCGLNKTETNTNEADVTKTPGITVVKCWDKTVTEQEKTAVLTDSIIGCKLVRIIDCEKPVKPLEPSIVVAGEPQTNILITGERSFDPITGDELTNYNPNYNPSKTNIATGNLNITNKLAVTEAPAKIEELEEVTILPCRTITRCNIGCKNIYVTEPPVVAVSPVSLNVFPNPSSDFIQLKTSNGSEITEVEIRDATGKNVFSESAFDSERTRIDVSSYKTGIYFVKVNAGGKFYTEQLVVKH
ncbi:MAG: hypothetical protein K0R65_546 [Crocinitomicaceae bacterium]|jgi:hypothetical protein|nr:hypothetical protein [Crocinitomicaceae bacterium]